MSYSVIFNKLNTSAALHITSNSDIQITGNNSISNIALENEIITNGYIKQIFWSCDPNSHIQLYTDGILSGVYDSSASTDYVGNGLSFNTLIQDQLNIRFIGSSNCYCMIEIRKIFDGIINTSPDYNLYLDFINQLYYTD